MSIKSIQTGTNSIVMKIETINGTNVCKQYGFEKCMRNHNAHTSRNTFDIVVKDLLKMRQETSRSNIQIPALYDWYYIQDNATYIDYTNKYTKCTSNLRLVLIEEYCGISFRELYIEKNANINDVEKIYKEILEIIKCMPLNLEFDANPANFTIKGNKISYIDFMPPKTTEYQSNNEIVELFPTIAYRGREREFRRTYRNTTTKGRIERFDYYLDKLTNQTKYPAQTQHASY